MLPPQLAPIILTFAPVFNRPTWEHALVLLWGAILAPGKRTVSSALRIMGLSKERQFAKYHRVLSRAVWNSRHASRLLLKLLLSHFAGQGPVIVGIDDTIERRRGAKIQAKGVYRDPVRSSDSHFVKTGGLRWLSLMLLAPIPWAGQVWALPFLTALAPSERYSKEHRQRHKALTDWARQLLCQLRRWLPERELVMVADGGFAALDLLTRLAGLARPITCITRLRLDARLYDRPKPRPKGRPGRPRLVGARLPNLQQVLENSRTRWKSVWAQNWYGQTSRTVQWVSATAIWYHGGFAPLSIRWVLIRDPQKRFDPVALLCTDPNQSPQQILAWFLLRWRVEVTFQEVRAHLGFETQRQWSDSAIAHSSPVLLGLFSLITLLTSRLAKRNSIPLPQAAWYRKTHPSFSDALALVRRHYWRHSGFFISQRSTKHKKIPLAFIARLSDALCFAA
jgi:DDE superfamily endonuclease